MTRTHTTLALAALGLAAAMPQAASAQGVFDFTNGTPRGSGHSYGYSGTLGVRFTVTAPVVVSDLGFFAPNLTVDSHTVGIFSDATQTLVGSTVTFAPGVQGPDPSTPAGSYVYLPDTIVLAPGEYTVAANFPNDGTAYNTADPFDDIAGPSSDSSDIVYDSSAYSDSGNPSQGGTLDFPPGGGAYASANIELAPAPEPSQTAALGLGLLGLAGLALRARKRA